MHNVQCMCSRAVVRHQQSEMKRNANYNKKRRYEVRDKWNIEEKTIVIWNVKQKEEDK